MNAYSLSMNTRTYFGHKCVEGALKKEKTAIGTRTLIVTTGGALKRLGYLEELISWIDSDVHIYDKIEANPDVVNIREAIEIGKKNKVNSVIGFGGGSAIDAAKATAVGIASELDIEQYLVKKIDLPKDTLPIIAIPTTAGSGAELSRGAIISSREKRIKTGIRGDRVAPIVAIVDPTYTYTLPFNVTMESGFDVFTHAAESYCAVKSNPFSEMLSEKAIKIVGHALSRLARDLSDHSARDEISFASHLMGYNVRNIGNCLPHRMQYPIGIMTDTSHGAGLIALYPSWIRNECEVNGGKIKQILNWLNANEGHDAGERIEKWLKMLNIDRKITDLGNAIYPKELESMVTGDLTNDKLGYIDGIVLKIYEESM